MHEKKSVKPGGFSVNVVFPTIQGFVA